MRLNDENLFEYTNVEWRFSGVAPSVFGIDPIIVAAPVGLFLGLSRQWGLIYFFFLALFVILCIYVKFFTDYRSVGAWVHSVRTRYFQRCQWETE